MGVLTFFADFVRPGFFLTFCLFYLCSLTGIGVVDRVITNLGVFNVAESNLKVIQLAPDVSLEEVKEQ